MKHVFLDKSLWHNALGATFGTIVGIVLTFGTTYWLQQRDKTDMAHKIAKITLRNLDVRIGMMKKEVALLKQQDSLFQRVSAFMPDRLNKLPDDTLLLFINTMGHRTYNMTDRKSERIFSSSFEMWQYLDDVKIIGRISNCYTAVDFHNEIFEGLSRDASEAHRTWWSKMVTHDFPNRVSAVKSMMNQANTQLLIERMPNAIKILDNLTDIAYRLNERNKEAMGISGEELEEVGRLLEKNSYEFGN